MSQTSPVSASVMTTYSDLPEAIRNHLAELEAFIGDCDGQWTALQTSDANVILDNGTIDASDAVKAFNGIIATLRSFGFAQTPAEPHETTYLRGWNEAVERCAEIAESSAVTSNGAKLGIGIATKIRTLSDTSTDRPLPYQVPPDCRDEASCVRNGECMYVGCSAQSSSERK